MTTLRDLFVCCLFLIPCVASGQSNVDRLSRALDSLSLQSFNNWKVSPDLKGLKLPGDPTKAGFDDSKWDNLRLNESIYPDSCWIRKEVTLPQTYLGKNISGAVRFLVSVDDYGYLWVNGESKGMFPWDGDFELTKNAKPGQKFLLVIKAINTGGPLRLIRAQLRTQEASNLVSTIQNFSLSLRVGEKLLSFDTYQTSANKKFDPKTDLSTMDRGEKQRLSALLQQSAAAVDVTALGAGDMNKFLASLASARSQLAPVKEYAKRFTLYFDANAHIDAAWLWRDKETIEVCKNTFSSVFNMMAARPEFTYTQSAAAYYDWMERLYPDIFKGIQQRVKDGRWEIVGGMWVEPDCNLPGAISWNRHLLYSKRYFKQKFGADVKIGWNPDSFGYNWNMPMFYRLAGIDAFVTQKIGWNETNVFPYRVFWWESPDKSRVLTYFPYDYVNTVEDPFRLVDWLRQFEANTGFRKMMILFGVGDHGGGPSIEMLDRIKRLDSLDIFPSIEYGTTGTYLSWLKSQNLSSVPVWKDELYLEYHQGTYTTQAAMKELNRKSEVLLSEAEIFAAVGDVPASAIEPDHLESAWRSVLFNQFHDILPGSGIRENYIDAREKYQRADALASHELNGALESIARNVKTNKRRSGIPFLLFNPLSWKRTDLATIELDAGGMYVVTDENGTVIPSQIEPKDDLHESLIFVATDVPPVGYKTYWLTPAHPTDREEAGADLSNVIENANFRITVDKDSGWVKGIYDKKAGREVLSGFGNQLQLLEDKPAAWDAWNVGLTGVEFPSKLRSVRVVEHGPVRTVLRVTRDYLKPGTVKDFPTEDFPSSFFTQDIALVNGLDRIDFKTDVDWWEDKTMLKVAFNCNVSDSMATYEIPSGSIRRSTQMRDSWEKAKVEVPAETWVDLSQDDYGVSLLNRSKYGFDIKGNRIRMSLLRSPKWPDPTADRGKHSIEYSLVPHQLRLDPSDAARRGHEVNAPLIALRATAHGGKLAPAGSFLKIEPSSLVVTSVKKAEDSDALVVQWYDARGAGGDAVVTLPRTPASVRMSNFLEEDGEQVPSNGSTVKVHTNPNSTVTIKVKF